MSDQNKWFKLWNSSIEDDGLDNLELDDWARWAKLAAYITTHGREGMIRFESPYRKLLTMFRVPTIEAAKHILKLFPNVKIGQRVIIGAPETPAIVSIEIEYTNWSKYQGDLSTGRVHKFRHKKRASETTASVSPIKKNTVEPPLPTSEGPAKVREWFEKTWKQYPKERRIGKKAAFRSYQRDVKVLDDALRVARALDVYLKSKTVQDGFVRNASTFFANVGDYDDERRDSAGAAGPVSETGGTPGLPGMGIDARTREVVAGLGNPIPSANPKNGS